MSCTTGEQILDFLYSEDAAKAFLLLGQYRMSEKTYVLGSAEGKSLRQYMWDGIMLATSVVLFVICVWF